MSDWQPIETAPKDDETWILVYLGTRTEGCLIHVARLGRIPIIGGTLAWDSGYKPTHWMPLPEPPAKEPRE